MSTRRIACSTPEGSSCSATWTTDLESAKIGSSVTTTGRPSGRTNRNVALDDSPVFR